MRDDDALPIRADARVLGATLKAGESIRLLALGPSSAAAIWFRPPGAVEVERHKELRRAERRRHQGLPSS